MKVVPTVVDEVTVTSISLVIKMELVRVTESPVSIEDEQSAELLVTEKLHKQTLQHTKHNATTYH